MQDLVHLGDLAPTTVQESVFDYEENKSEMGCCPPQHLLEPTFKRGGQTHLESPERSMNAAVGKPTLYLENGQGCNSGEMGDRGREAGGRV